MSTDGTYNGWSSYATWRVNLEICDDRIQLMSEDFESGDMDPFTTVSDLADYLKEDATEAIAQYGELSDESLAVSYALAFLDTVNWHEIAQHAIDDNPDWLAPDSAF